jgi:hypothetical protein
MIGIHEVWRCPVKRLHSGIRLGAKILGLGANKGVLAVRLVPHWVKRHTALGCGFNCRELGLALVGKTVAHTDSKSW